MNRHSPNCALPEEHDFSEDFPPEYMVLSNDSKISFLCNWCGERFTDVNLASRQKKEQMRDSRLINNRQKLESEIYLTK